LYLLERATTKSDPGTAVNAGLTIHDSLLGSIPLTPSISSSRAFFMESHRRFPSTPNSIGTDLTLAFHQ
jgi:hypothetical protein